MIRLRIEKTWDGAEARPGEVIELELAARGDGITVLVDAPFHEDPPPPVPVGSTWALWDYQVVELFVLGEGERYLELELGPHGHFLALSLEGRRRIVARHDTLDYQAEILGSRWRGNARIPWSLLPLGELRMNAYGMHGIDGERRHLAWMPVPGPAPDFHRLEHFAPSSLQLPHREGAP